MFKELFHDTRSAIIAVVVTWGFNAGGTWYKQVLIQAQHGTHLNPFQSAIVSLPTPVIVTASALIFLAVFFALHWLFSLKKPTQEKAPGQFATSHGSASPIYQTQVAGDAYIAVPVTTPHVAPKPDFRVSIDNLTVDAPGGDPTVVAAISVTNYGERASIDQWQMLYWFDGKKKEAGRQDLQHRGAYLRDYRIENRFFVAWGYDQYIGLVTKTPFANREKRKGFFWAVLTDSSGITNSDLRTIYLQYQSEGNTFESPSVGGNLRMNQVKQVLGQD